jgi:N-acetylmuramoyl-L-alanine amidase CwlA
MRRKFSNKYQDLLTTKGPIAVFEAMHNPEIFNKTIRVYGWEDNGTSSYDHNLIASVNKYLFEELEVIEAMIPEGLENRPGIIKESTKYICIHDTAGARKGAGATAHKNYVCNGGGGTSWHYSSGDDGIYHHLPNNEVAYHAGDGSRTYNLVNSGVIATTAKPIIDISEDGFYTLNGEKLEILAPTNDGKILSAKDINDLNIEVVIGDDNYYYLGTTWYSKTYNLIGNGGGNRNSIGIESMIDNGCDLYLVWQRLAKLVASLLLEQNLNLDAVVQHHFFSGKDCPKTMRKAAMWDHFLDLVEAEYFVLTQMKDYSISIIPKSKNIDNNGRIINQEDIDMELNYTLVIKDKFNNQFEKDFKSIYKKA